MPDSLPDVKLDHVAIGVPEVAAAAPFLMEGLGGRPLFGHPAGPYRFWQWQFDGGGVLEMLQPDGPPGGFMHRFLATRGPGVHHVTFKVPDLERAMQHARDTGYEIVGYDDRLPHWKEAFLHPRQAQGIVVQLAESHPERRPDVASDAFPEVAGPTPEPVRLLGVRLAARDAERARRQWQTLLGGDCAETDAGLDFRWPDSPLRIRVVPEATAGEGPLALEVASHRALALPEGPHPLLGIPFVQIDG